MNILCHKEDRYCNYTKLARDVDIHNFPHSNYVHVFAVVVIYKYNCSCYKM